MIYSYMRQVPSADNLVSQKNDILTFSHHKKITIDKEVIEYATKDLLIDDRDEFETFLRSLGEGDYTVVVASLAVLSTRVDELVKVINCMLSHEVDLWICDIGVLINKYTSMLEIFPLLEQQRKKPKDDVQIGRPKGSKSHSKFDIYHNEIMKLLTQKQSVSSIARDLDVSRSSLKDYIESRELKALAASIGAAIDELVENKVDNMVVICPFEEEAKLKEEKVSQWKS